jgi:competence protein ComEC
VTFRKPGEEWKERRDPYEVGKKQLVPLLKQRGVHQLDLLVISHQDQDHIGGLQAVVEQIPVRTVVMNGTWKGNAGSRKLFETAMRRGAEIVTLEEGKTVALDRYTELTALTASGPEMPVRLAEEQNNESVVLLLNMRNIRFLFTGDMEARQEKLLLEALNRTRGDTPSSSPVSVDVLKIAHHGSKTSTTEEWLAFWQPRMSVISVGLKNSYGHPNPGVLERLERSGTTIYRTDRDGEVVFTVTGQGVRVDKKL